MCYLSAVLRDRPFFALAIALSRAAVPPAVLRAAPMLAAVTLAAVILFGGYGMRARDVIALLAASRIARLALWSAWILVTAPAARALLREPSTFVLRALPAPLAWFHLVGGAHLIALHTPWILLFARGAGALSALAAALAAAAFSAFTAARPRAFVEVAAALALAAAVLAPAPPALLLAAAAPASAVALAAAFRRAPEREASARAAWIFGPAPLALTITHAVLLARRDAVTLLRGLLAALTGALIATLAARNNSASAPGDLEIILLTAGALPLSIAVSGVAARALATERGLDWLLLSTAATPRLRALTAAAVPILWGAACGAAQGVTTTLSLNANLPRLPLLTTLLGASLAAVAAGLARRAERPTGVDGTALTAGMTATAFASMALSANLGAQGALAFAAMATLGAAATPHLLARRERRAEHAARAPWETE